MIHKTQITLRALTVLLLCSLSFSLFAQRERNYIYILDCSNSMEETYHIFQPTLDYLQKDIARLSANTMVTIIPFQGSVYDTSVKHCLKKDLSWDKFAKEVTPYVTQLAGTNICQAWDYALNYIDPNKDNYIYLLTDGKDNRNPRPDGTEAVCRRIREWCGKHANSQGYYVALSNEAMDARIIAAVDECSNFQRTQGIELPFGSFDKAEMYYNTLDPHDASLSFSAVGQFSATAVGDSVIAVTLVGGQIREGRATFHFEPRADLAQLPQSFSVNVKVSSSEVDILNPDLTLHVTNIPERSLQLPAEEIDLGKVEWYDKFWWKDAKTIDTLTIDLNPQYNQSAREMAAHIKLQFAETTTDDKGHVTGLQSDFLFNGQPCPDGRIDIDPGQPAVLSIIPHADSEEGKHYYTLTPVDNSRRNLENINQQPVSDYCLTLRSEFDVDINPLKLTVIILTAILILVVLLWFFVLKPMIFPTIKLSSLQMECEPIYKTPRINGCRKVVFTNRRQSQSALARIVTGEVKYIREDFWDSEWSLGPGTKKTRLRASGTSGYSMNPPGNTIEKLETVEMKSLATGQKIRITVK